MPGLFSILRQRVTCLLFSVFLLSGFPALTQAAEEGRVQYADALQALDEGRYDDARRLLRAVIKDTPGHAGAWLDLAILYCNQGDAGEAAVLFNEIEQQFTPPPRILDVIKHVRAQGCHGNVPTGRSSLTFGAGHDDNVNQGSAGGIFNVFLGQSWQQLEILPQYRRQADSFVSAAATQTWPLDAKGTLAFAQLSLKQYRHMDEYDTVAAQIGIERGLLWRGWHVLGSASTGRFNLGNSPYLQQVRLQVRAIPPLPLPRDWFLGVQGNMSRAHYFTASAFDNQSHELQGFIRHKSSNGEWQFSLGLTRDKATNKRPGGDRAGFSAAFEGRRQLAARWQLNWQFEHLNWQADSDYSVFLPEQQHQRTTRLIGSLRYAIDDKNALIGEVTSVDNQDKIKLFAYRSNSLFLGWQFNF